MDNNNNIVPSFCSVYIPDKVFFGGYPSSSWFNSLCDFGITLFVDLTTKYEKNHLPYVYSFDAIINHPIRDNSIPYKTENYYKFIVQLASYIKSGTEKIYIHCKGGHGRSGLVIASLMCYLDNMHPIDALKNTTILHSTRKELKAKYRNSHCPDNYVQKQYVIELFRPICIANRNIKNLFEFIHTTRNSSDFENVLTYFRHFYYKHDHKKRILPQYEKKTTQSMI